MSHTRQVAFILGAFILLMAGFNNCGANFAFRASDQLIVANAASTGSIEINDNAPFTNSKDVAVSLFFESANEMYLTNDPTCKTGGTWEAYRSERPWELAQANSKAEVYVKFKEGNAESGCYTDDIIHDDVPPRIDVTKAVASFINTSSAELQFTATDALSGVQGVTCQSDGGSTDKCDGKKQLSGLKEGAHSVILVAKDNAGNVSQPMLVPFIVDMTPPTIAFNMTPPAVTADLTAQFRFTGNDGLSGVASFECRTATTSFTSCSSPFTATYPEGAQSLIVRAIDRAGNASSEIRYNWTIDASAPSVRITEMPNPITNNPDATFRFEGTDNGQPVSRFECSVNGSAYAACTSPFVRRGLSAGLNTFMVRALDSASNVSAPATYEWTIDLEAPTVLITAQPPAVTANPRADFAFTATDNFGIARTECRLDGEAYAACTSPRAYLTLPDGSHTFYVRAVDNAGNVSQPVSRTWLIDTIKPTVTITSGPADKSPSPDATFAFIGSDASGGPLTYECRIDGAPYAACTSPAAFTAIADGTHSFMVRARDAAGNYSDPASRTWLIDTLAPSINFVQQPLSGIRTNETAVVQFTVADAGVGIDVVKCGLDGSIVVCPEAASRSFSGMTVGDHVFTVEATDLLGNKSVNEARWTVKAGLQDRSIEIDVAASNNKADILVVIDNSGSMAPEQSNMAARFATFIDQLNALDWQISIVTTDMSSDAPKKDGRMLPFTTISSSTYILNSAMNRDTAKAAFAATIQRPQSEGDGYEQGIAASYRAIERSLDPTTITVSEPNRQFFRQGAVLAVLVVTDANETPRNGTQVRNTPEGLLNFVKSTWSSQKPFVFHSIIVPEQDSVCLSQSGNEAYGTSYATLSRLTGGVIGSVCATDYGSQLSAMGKGVDNLVRSVTLDCLPVDTNGDGKADISVDTADGSATPSYLVDGMKVTFSQALPVGKNVIHYTCPL